jgi:hypothetical protein
MKCRRAFETDLLAVVRGESGDREFLAHSPTCADCAAELRVWGELDAMLRAGAPAPAAHPSEETLLALVDAPATLAAEARAEVERHLAGCRACADEVATLRHFEPSHVSVPDTPPAPPLRPPEWRTPPADHPSGGWLGRIVWHPAFAYALVAVLLVPLVRSQLGRLSVPAHLSQAERERRQVPLAGAPPPRADAPATVGAVAPAPGLDAAAKMRVVEKKAEADAERANMPRLAARAQEAPGANAGGAPTEAEAPVTFIVRSNAPTVVPFAAAQRGLLLQIAPPVGFGGRALDVTVRARAGAKELTQRVVASADAIALPIPAHWLGAGDYTIALVPVAPSPLADRDAAETAPAPMTLGFSVSAPVAAR